MALGAGPVRVLEWRGGEPPAVFLHGLTAVAEVWGPTIDALGGAARAIAPDLRGHGHSFRGDVDYRVGAFVGDLIDLLDAMALERPHLVGHSMGGRVAIAAAARHPERFRSVTIVDIGPEAWRANWVETVEALDRMPESFPDRETALAGLSRRTLSADEAEIALARLRREPDGSYRWLADREALKETVRLHRSRNYWRECERIPPPALLVRGGRSNELRERVAAEMRRRSPAIAYVELEGVGHNIPLAAPDRLAEALARFWASANA